MSLYELFFFIHVLAAATWVGGAITIQVLAIRAQRSTDLARLTVVAGEAEYMGLRVLTPAALVVVLAGIAMVLEGEIGWPLWIVLGLVAYALSFLTGLLFLGPESGRIKQLLEQRGAEDPGVQARIRRIFLISRIELVVLVLIVFDMAVKPGT